MVQIVARTHQGLVRLNNEDAVYADSERRFAILADGMGGLMAGEVASRTAVDAARVKLMRDDTARDSADAVCSVLQVAHEAVVRRAKSSNYVGKMGTTLLLWVGANGCDDSDNGRSFFAHVGDSRIYTYSHGSLVQVTKDHTVAQKMVDDGHIAQEDEPDAPNRNVLTSALGIPGLCHPDCGEIPAADRILMCSDGLSDLVPVAQISAIMQTDDLSRCTDELLKAALDAGGRDNVSVVLLEF